MAVTKKKPAKQKATEKKVAPKKKPAAKKVPAAKKEVSVIDQLKNELAALNAKIELIINNVLKDHHQNCLDLNHQ